MRRNHLRFKVQVCTFSKAHIIGLLQAGATSFARRPGGGGKLSKIKTSPQDKNVRAGERSSAKATKLQSTFFSRTLMNIVVY